MSIAVGTKFRVTQDRSEYFAIGTIGTIVEPNEEMLQYILEGESVAAFEIMGDQQYYVRETAAPGYESSILVEVIDEETANG